MKISQKLNHCSSLSAHQLLSKIKKFNYSSNLTTHLLLLKFQRQTTLQIRLSFQSSTTIQNRPPTVYNCLITKINYSSDSYIAIISQIAKFSCSSHLSTDDFPR